MQLWKPQQGISDLVVDQKEVALLNEQRTGKTHIALDLLNRRCLNGLDLEGLVIGPLSNIQLTWYRMFKELCSQINVTRGWEEFLTLPRPKVFLVHYEHLSRKMWPELHTHKAFNHAIIDEAHALANPTSNQSKAAHKLSFIPWKIILTGTPIEKSPSHIWSQFKFLAPHVLGSNWKEFQEDWMIVEEVKMEGVKYGSMQWQELMVRLKIAQNRAQFIDRLMPFFLKLLSPYCYRLDVEDVGITRADLTVVKVPMDERARRLDRRLKRDRMVMVNGEEIIPHNGAILKAKRGQLANGFIFDELGSPHWVGDHKLRALKRVLKRARS